MTPQEIRNLALLARIEVTDAEVAGYAKDFDSILGYVSQINTVDISEIELQPLQSNGARIDTDAHPSGQYHKKMLADAPDSDDGFYKVPKIL